MIDEEFRKLLAVEDNAKFWEQLKPLLEAGEITDTQFDQVFKKLKPPQYRAAHTAKALGASRKPANDPLDLLFRAGDPLFKGGDLKKFGLAWWANYFYQECDAEAKKKFFREVYRVNQGQLTIKPQLDPSNPRVDTQFWADCMDRMLKNGFTEFPPEFRSTDDVLIPRLTDDPDLRVGFRGELRQPMDVRKHNGCRPRAHILGLLPEMNINKPWHPYYIASNRTKLYYRKGNGDNCLHTAVSVAIDFDTASKFPLLSDLNEADDVGTATVEAEGIESNVAKLRAQMGATITRQHFDPGVRAWAAAPKYDPGPMPKTQPSTGLKPYKAPAGIRLLKSVRMNVYLFLVRGEVYNTQGYQVNQKNAPFPERASAAIPWEHFLARLMIDRIHFGPDSNDGHLNVISGYQFLHFRRDLQQALGGGTDGSRRLISLTNFLQGLYDRGKLNGDGSGGLPFKTANTPAGVRITKVLKIEPRRDWGINPAR